MRSDRFLPQTWFDARLVPAPSAIHGTGLFASAAFDVGEVVMVWGGSVWTRAQLEAGEVPRCSFSFVDEDVLLAAPAEGLDYFVNDSCDPSAWMTDEVTVVARRSIPAGGEVTGDYALGKRRMITSLPGADAAPTRVGARSAAATGVDPNCRSATRATFCRTSSSESVQPRRHDAATAS